MFEEQYKLSREMVKKVYEPLNTYNERVFIVEMAFFVVGIILLLAGIPVFIVHGKK